MNIRTLVLSARASALARGHDMKPVTVTRPASGHTATSNCRRCGMQFQCLTHPQPNEIGIGGEAVALSCKAVPVYGINAGKTPGTVRNETLRQEANIRGEAYLMAD